MMRLRSEMIVAKQSFVIMLRPAHKYAEKGSDEKIDEHFRYLQGLKVAGNLTMAGLFSEVLIGLVLIEAETVEEARKIMMNDPAVKAGVFYAELYPWHIALKSDK